MIVSGFFLVGVFLDGAFLDGDFLGSAFLGSAFLGSDFLGGAFLGGAFLVAFLAATDDFFGAVFGVPFLTGTLAAAFLAGAFFCDRRYDHVFVYHNGAESYYATRGFRGRRKV